MFEFREGQSSPDLHTRSEVRLGSNWPGMCAHRHIIGPGEGQVWYVHCFCPASRNGGHLAWFCVQCEREYGHEEAVMYPAGHLARYEVDFTADKRAGRSASKPRFDD